MGLLVLVGLVSLVLGGVLGQRLASRGITADNALEHHQSSLYKILIAIALIGAVFLVSGRLNRTQWIPLIVLLVIGEYTKHFVLGLGSFAVGLLAALEWPGRRDHKRLRQAVMAVALMVLPLAGLVYYSMPVNAILGAHRMVDGVVLQTTAYTCAPASIATLTRLIYPERPITEADVVTLAGTNRFGTTPLAELRAMRRLGLRPRLERGLTVEKLAMAKPPALLHVKEPIGGALIGHAIVLVKTNPVEKTFTLANPIYGQEVRSFERMQGYWQGEAIFVDAS